MSGPHDKSRWGDKMRARDELVWTIKGQTPETLPMARLAEYMKQLAIMLGQPDDLRFVRIEEGSLAVVAKTSRRGNAGQVVRRVDGLQYGRGHADAVKAYRHMNEMVAEDGKSARLARGAATILHFPGTVSATPELVKMLDHGFITGKLYALSEDSRSNDVKARIRPNHDPHVINCTASQSVGRTLRGFLFDAVRVHGKGEWTRGGDGAWACQSLHIDRVEPVKNVTLRAAINELRALDLAWSDDPLGDLYELNEDGEEA